MEAGGGKMTTRSRRKEGGGGERAGFVRVSKEGESGKWRLLITAPGRALSEFSSPPCSLSGGGIKGEGSQSRFSLAPPAGDAHKGRL